MKIRIPKLTHPHRAPESSPVPKAYRPWLILSLAILIVSLLALVVVGALAFVYYANVLTPIWLTLLGTVSAAGVALGFAGFFFLLILGAYTSFKQDRHVKPLPSPDNEVQGKDESL